MFVWLLFILEQSWLEPPLGANRMGEMHCFILSCRVLIRSNDPQKGLCR